MSPTVDGHMLPQNEFDLTLNLPATTSGLGVSGYTEHGDSYRRSPAISGVQPQSRTSNGGESSSTPRATEPILKPASPAVKSNLQKPKRVRTGCLTCRERHLKCDEAVPRCQNCQKSDRLCKRGLRLNFIDTQVAAPPYSLPATRDWRVIFHDESRDIASEYLGGYERYPSIQVDSYETGASSFYDCCAPVAAHHTLPADTPLLPTFADQTQTDVPSQMFQPDPQPSASDSALSLSSRSTNPFGSSKSSIISINPPRPYLNSAEEVLLMQVFVEEVGLWMDSMDEMKHFTQILPFHALSEPMLLNAFLACGARHLFLVNSSFGEEKALYYYNVSTRDLLSCLQNSNRNTSLCATTAVVLNVYEIMCERPMHRMNHIAGARALIKECKWDARSTGIGGACFWLNVGMELLSCLHFNWKMAWDPDNWNVDMNMAMSMGSVAGDEEIWTHRMIYICAKIAGFRCTVQQLQSLDRLTQESRIGQHLEEWNDLKAWCDEWARCIPRSMLPMGYLHPWETNSKSAFPEVWLIKRSAVVGRLFYHTAHILLAKIHPAESEFTEEMLAMQQSHAHDICGLVAHVKDRGVASVSLRCLAIAAECLVNRQAQEEVIQILDRIIKETGWQAAFIQEELIEKWGWQATATQVSQAYEQQQAMTTAPSAELTSSLLNSAIESAPTRTRLPQGVVNPLMATADFSFENHPYRNYYVAPENDHLSNFRYESY